MRKNIILTVLALIFCIFFVGCYTLDSLSKVHTGNVDFKDFWQALAQDDRDFQKKYW